MLLITQSRSCVGYGIYEIIIFINIKFHKYLSIITKRIG